MSKRKILLMQGPWDGQFVNVNEDQTQYEVKKVVSTGFGSTRIKVVGRYLLVDDYSMIWDENYIDNPKS